MSLNNTTFNGNLHTWHTYTTNTTNQYGSWSNPPLYNVNNVSAPVGTYGKHNLEVYGSLIVNGVDITELLNTISQRLLILVPDPERLAKFEQLQVMYEQYKLMEAMCFEPKNE